MGFVMCDEFFWMVRNYRVMYARGRYGSGKSLLAVATAVELWRRGLVDHIYSNLILRGDWFEQVTGSIRDAVIVFDEAWVELDSRSWDRKVANSWLAFLRKRNIYLLLASVTNVDVRFRTLQVQRSQVLPKLWRYQWVVNDGMKPIKGAFMIYDPGPYFEVFDTNEEPSADLAALIRNALAFGVPLKGVEGAQEKVIDGDTLEWAAGQGSGVVPR
jgi:hypothetical protein